MRDEKTILRQHRRHHFVQVPNETARDSSLSWKATGLLCFLLSLPDRWEINLAHLSAAKKDGRDATRAGMKELEDAGYLAKEVLRDAAGRIDGTQWTVSDFPFSENPKTAKPTQRIPSLTKTEKKEERQLVSTGDNFANLKKMGVIFENDEDKEKGEQMLEAVDGRFDLIRNAIAIQSAKKTKNRLYISSVGPIAIRLFAEEKKEDRLSASAANINRQAKTSGAARG